MISINIFVFVNFIIVFRKGIGVGKGKMASGERIIDEEEVAKHDKDDDCWIIIGNENTGGPKVYDVTNYLNEHPGGPEIMLEFKGKDADEMFEDIAHSTDARNKMKEYLVGRYVYTNKCNIMSTC